MNASTYEFRYLKEEHDIDIETFLVSQQNFLTILNEINRSSFPEATLKVRLSQPRSGSFIVEHIFELVPVGMFVSENLGQISTLFAILKDYFEIWKLLEGKKAENVFHVDNSVNININGNGHSFSEDAFKVYQSNNTVNKALFKGTNVLSKDHQIKGFEIKNSEETTPFIKVDRDDLQVFQKQNEYLDKAETITEIVEATLYVKKFDVAPKRTTKFTFFYEGRSISANIKDDQFIKRIIDGEKFGNGDSLLVDLEITKKFDENYNIYTIHKYCVLNVKNIKQRGDDSDQIDLF